MVQTQQVKSGGVELVAVHDLVGGLEAELVGRSIGGSRLDPPTSEPSGEATPVVVPSLGVLPLGGWLAPNSEVQMTRVSSSMPRDLRSLSRAEAPVSRMAPQ